MKKTTNFVIKKMCLNCSQVNEMKNGSCVSCGLLFLKEATEQEYQEACERCGGVRL